MKKQAHILIAMLVLVGFMAVGAQAQSGGMTVIAHIPFDFNVGNKTLPAGEYRVRQLNLAVLKLESKDGRASAVVMTNSVSAKEEQSPKLIFNRYGSRYFFAQAWIEGSNSGLQAPKSRAERSVERELAGLGHTTETIALRRQ
jgi:hypothetical protein